jgi:putative ABC transport system ATP-binding protein
MTKNNSILKINNLSYGLIDSENLILKNINYEIFQNDFVIILGSNGSGKSTLLKLIDKRLRVNPESIFLQEKDLNTYFEKDYFTKVKTLTQNCDDSLFLSLSLYENYLLATNKKVTSHKNEKDFLRNYLFEFSPKLASKLDDSVKSFSGGEKQTLVLALTLINPPLLLLLDEHTSALDPKTAELNMQLTCRMIKKYNITCVLTTHNLKIAEHYGSRILGIANGEVLTSVEENEKHTLTNDVMYKMFY